MEEQIQTPQKMVDLDNENLSEDGLTPEYILMIMEHTNCSRNQAIKALRQNNDDMV